MPGSQYCGPHQPKGKLSEREDLGLLVESPSGVISWMSYIEDELIRLHNTNALGHRTDSATG